MRLEVLYKKNKDGMSIDKDFIKWLKSNMSDKIKSSIDEKKLIRWNDYLNSGEVIEFTSRKNILAKEVIYLGADNLVVSELPNKFIISINNKKFVNGLKMVKIDTLCKLINYGNASIKGYPIFSDVFNEVANNIDMYIEVYYMFIKGDIQ
jgi:hypothetical protein